jgi:hypothetical protein
MAFTEFRFDAASIRDLVEVRRANIKANTSNGDMLGFCLGVVAKRLDQDPRRYTDYGPYWWALKDALRAGGRDYGEQSDPIIAQTYRGDTDEQTVIMADEFRTEYLKTNVIYNGKFLLDAASPEWYVVFDPDMEQRH